MGKRGPDPKGEYVGKSGVLSTRIRPDTRQFLEQAARVSGRSLSQEIEHRLRRTLHADEKAADEFGSVRNWRMLQIIGMAMTLVRNPDHPNVDWLDDPWMYDQAVKQITVLLELLRPRGEIISPENGMHSWSNEQAAQMIPLGLVTSVQASDTSLPLAATARQHKFNQIKADLGKVADRLDQGDVVHTETSAEKMAASIRKKKVSRPRKVHSPSLKQKD